MGIRQLEQYPHPTAEYLEVVVVDVTEPGVGPTPMYEVHCGVCGGFDVFEQRSAAETYGPSHVCEVS